MKNGTATDSDRARIRLILMHPNARDQQEAAKFLALETEMTAAEAIRVLALTTSTTLH